MKHFKIEFIDGMTQLVAGERFVIIGDEHYAVEQSPDDPPIFIAPIGQVRFIREEEVRTI